MRRAPTSSPANSLIEEALRRAPHTKPKIPASYRQFLNLDPQDLVAFFDVKVGERQEFAEMDFVVPPSVLEHRIRRLMKVIACSKQIVEGLSVHIMKIRRGKDEVLDQPTREKYKREEQARIARCNMKLARYRMALRSPQGYREKVWMWVKTPVHFRDVVDDVMTFDTVIDAGWRDIQKVFTGGVETHTRVEWVEYIRSGHVDLESYRAVMSLGVAALAELGETESQRKEVWDNIHRWENAVIRAAVVHSVITPRRDLAELLGLGQVLDEPDDVIEADRTEDALAIKTGGACYGGRVQSEGYRYRGGRITPRGLSSFDKPLRGGRDGAGYDDPGFNSLDNASDDAESYVPK